MSNIEIVLKAVDYAITKSTLEELIYNNPKARGLEKRVSELAKISQKEAFLLVYEKIRKKDMFDLIKGIEKVNLMIAESLKPRKVVRKR